MGLERSERERERVSDAVALGDEGRAVGRASGRLAACCGKSRAGWGAELGHARCGPVREGSSGPKRAGHAVQCGQATGIGRRSRPAWEKEKEKGLAGSVGPKWKKMNFSKSNHFPNLFPLFPRFKSNSNVI